MLLAISIWPNNTQLLKNSTNSINKASKNTDLLTERGNPQEPGKHSDRPAIFALTEDDQSFANYLIVRFGQYLHRPKARLQLLEELIAYTHAKLAGPSDSELTNALSIFLRATFPSASDLLMKELEAFMGYQHRMSEEKKHALVLLDQQQRQAQVWQIREEFFGIDAKEIWHNQWQAQQFLEALLSIESNQSTVEA